MRISLELTPESIIAIARHLDDPACLAGDIARDTLTRFVAQASILHGVISPEIRRVMERDYASFGKARRTPRSLAKRKGHIARR